MGQARSRSASRTHQGQVRARNEDALAVYPAHGLFVVADGIGGASAGDVASQLAVRIISDRFLREVPAPRDPRQALALAETAIEEANGAVYDTARRKPECAGMGTTVVVGYLGPDWLAYSHVGDSRLYLLRDGELVQLTNDHSFIQEVVDQGFFPNLQEARDYGINENVLTRAVGSSARVMPSSDVIELIPGDLFLFCTDGLSNMVSRGDLQHLLSCTRANLETPADALVHLACNAGGVDNITLILLRITGLGERAEPSPAAAG